MACGVGVTYLEKMDTLLLLAIKYKYESSNVTSMLLRHWADVNGFVKGKHTTPIEEATRSGHAKLVKLHLENCARPRTRTSTSNELCLCEAMEHDDVERRTPPLRNLATVMQT